jgi:hypothetical protein
LTTFNLVLALVPTPAARVTRAALAQSLARNSPLSSKSPALAAVFSAMHAAS